MNRRPLVAGALAAVAVASTGLLSACSSGQIAQTAAVKPGVGGVNADGPDGRRVYIRDLTVDFHGTSGYAKGGTAPMALWIFNGTEAPVTLTSVETAFEHQVALPSASPSPTTSPSYNPIDTVISSGGNSAAPCSVPSSVTPTTAAPSPSPSSAAPAASSPSAKSSGRTPASASPSASPSGSPSPSPSPTVGSPDIHVVVPAGGCVELSGRAALYLQLTDLPEALSNTVSVAAVFTFSDGKGGTFTIGTAANPVQIPVAVPDSPEPRQT